MDSNEKGIKEIPIIRLTEKMRIASDVLTTSGVLVVAKGQDVGASLIVRLSNFSENKEISENVFVYADIEEDEQEKNVA